LESKREELGWHKRILFGILFHHDSGCSCSAIACHASERRDRRFNKSNYQLERSGWCNQLQVAGIDFFDFFDICF